ncbi:MAG: ComF family protein [Thiohalospira sp.]
MTLLTTLHHHWRTIRRPLGHGRCRLCMAPAGDSGLCIPCQGDLPRNRRPCPGCAEPHVGPGLCRRCIDHPLSAGRIQAPWLYDWPLDRLIRAMKFRGDLAAARTLGELLAGAIEPGEVEFMVPVPLHGRRLAERGYNQALEIARPVSRHRGIPLQPAVARRRRATRAQAELAAERRRANVRDAFVVPARQREALRGRHIAIVDDVVTTGETTDALATVLRTAGAASVAIWAVARAEGANLA